MSICPVRRDSFCPQSRPPSLLKLNRVITIIIITLRAISQRRAEAGRERLKVRELGGRSAGRYEDNHWSRGKRPETRKGC